MNEESYKWMKSHTNDLNFESSKGTLKIKMVPNVYIIINVVFDFKLYNKN